MIDFDLKKIIAELINASASLKKLHNIMLKKVEKYADKKFKKGNIVPKRIALLPFLALMNKYVNYVFKKL